MGTTEKVEFACLLRYTQAWPLSLLSGEAARWAGHWLSTRFNSIKVYLKFAPAFYQECQFLTRRKLLIPSFKKVLFIINLGTLLLQIIGI